MFVYTNYLGYSSYDETTIDVYIYVFPHGKILCLCLHGVICANIHIYELTLIHNSIGSELPVGRMALKPVVSKDPSNLIGSGFL